MDLKCQLRFKLMSASSVFLDFRDLAKNSCRPLCESFKNRKGSRPGSWCWNSHKKSLELSQNQFCSRLWTLFSRCHILTKLAKKYFDICLILSSPYWPCMCGASWEGRSKLFSTTVTHAGDLAVLISNNVTSSLHHDIISCLHFFK